MRCMHAVVVAINGRKEFVPCGRCNFCLEARRADWSFRLRQEAKLWKDTQFVTLTYEKAPKSESGLDTLRKKDFQDFVKRFRKSCPTKVRYYAVGEYGSTTQRPHYHALLFNAPLSYVESDLVATWSHGLVSVYPISDARIHYVTKFHVNAFGDYSGREPPFALMSRRPGIGANYLTTTSARWHLQEGYLKPFAVSAGFKHRLPRYYADKLFSKDDKESLRLMAPSEREAYFLELERLKSLGVEFAPEHYLHRLKHQHDAVKHKSNRNDQL